MKINVETEAPRYIENGGDLRWRRVVGMGTTADQIGAGFACRDEQFVRTGVVQQHFLRKHTDLQIDRPGILALEAANCVEAAQADAWIDFDMRAHARRPVDDRFLQRAACPRVDIILGEGALCGGDLRDRLLQRSLVRMTAVQNAGLVEMNVRFDEARRYKPAAGMFVESVG